MENFTHIPEPFRIRVIEPVKRTTREHREKAIVKAGMNPFLLDSEDVFIDLLTDSGTGAVTQDMQAAMLRGDEAYSGSRSYHALAKAVKEIFGYQYTIPTHQGRGAEQIYIPVLIKKREQEKGLDRSKMVAFSNYFFDTTQGHSQINGCTVKNTYTKEAFDTGIKYDFKGNFDLEKLEAGIKEAGAENVPYIVCTITCNSAGGQPVSIANLRGMYAIAQKYDIPVVMDSARFAENAYFIQQREPGYQNKSIEEITRESYQYADIFAMSAKKDAMVPMGGLLCIKDDRYLDVIPNAAPSASCKKVSRLMAVWKAARWSVWRLVCMMVCVRTGSLTASARCSIWWTVLKPSASFANSRAGMPLLSMPANCCRIFRPSNSRRKRLPASCIKSPVSVRWKLAHSCKGAIRKPASSYPARQNSCA